MAGEDFDIHAFLAQEAFEASLLAESTQGSSNINEKLVLKDLPSFYKTIWPKVSSIPSGWLQQTLGFVEDKDGCVGILQPINGPCGVLAVIQGLLFVNRLKNNIEIDVQKPFSDEELANCLSELICFHSVDNKVKLYLWKDEIGKQVEAHNIKVEECGDFILNNLKSYKTEGCLCLLLYSIVATKTEEEVKKDFKSSGSGPSLVETTTKPDIWFCSSDLMTLLLTGSADGNLGAFDAVGKKRKKTPKTLGIGLLSRIERETKVPVLDSLKHPNHPVWILHSGDHFTIFAQKSLKNENEFIFFNGLPPSGPKLSEIKIEFTKISPQTQENIEQTDFVPLPGEIYDIVQANADDKKKTKDFTTWRFEVVLAVNDPTIKGPERPVDLKVELFDLGEKPKGHWRCGNCYRNRHKTYCFGENKVEKEGALTKEECKFCGKSKIEAQWSIWLEYKDLPSSWKRSAQFHYGPKILSILTTRWLDIEIISPKVDVLPSV